MPQKMDPIFLIAIVLHFLSYTLPFVDSDLGYEFFSKALSAFYKQRIRDEEIILFFAFFSPIITLPFLCWACRRETIPVRWKLEFSLFSIFLFSPVLLTAFFVLVQSGKLPEDFMGYFSWLVSFVLLFIIYIQKLRKTKSQDEDISKHLIEND